MIGLIAAFQFLTAIPPLVRRPFTNTELGRAVGWFPLVGLALGGLLYGITRLGPLIFPDQPALIALIILLIWVASTRALHLDGLMDTCDGLFGGFTSERRLEIMRDPRVGAFGVVSGMLALLFLAVEISGVITADRLFVLVLAPVIARWGMSTTLILFPYARPEGLGSAMKDSAGWPELILSTLITVFFCSLIGGLFGLVLIAVAALVTLFIALFAQRRINGLTGDIYGAICVCTEITVLLISLSALPTLVP